MSCFVWESNHIKIKSLQSSCCSNDLDLTVPSQRHESMADRLIYLVRNGTWTELLFLLAEPMLSHVLTFCMVNSSTHLDMVLRLVANNWLLSDRVSQRWWQKKNPTKSYRVVRGSLFPANEGTCIPLLGVLLLNCSKQSIPNPAQKTICQNKTSNALPMANRMCCENEAAADSLSWLRNSDNYQ